MVVVVPLNFSTSHRLHEDEVTRVLPSTLSAARRDLEEMKQWEKDHPGSGPHHFKADKEKEIAELEAALAAKGNPA